jgi:hypothetical protein
VSKPSVNQPSGVRRRNETAKITLLFAAARESGFVYGFRTPAHHERCRALGAGVRKPPKNETAGEGTNSRAAFGVSARTGGRFFVQPERYGTKIAK